MTKRYCPNRAFPPYAFVPGEGKPHPEKAGGHMEHTEITGEKLDDYRTNQAYLFAIDLYNHGYYWESHVWWEYLWHLEGRKGATADFLKGLIKLAAGKLKDKMGQQEIAEQHYDRAFELFAPLKSPHMGIDIREVTASDQLHLEL